ncbi:MAG: monofunctional biosynthetic peptidoglycan transglycosylase [Alphaproteobacteria bacterium]|nr:MAG: monofunctional biosynthetic peptidoglycan transglycosylase [Alphaproteobacteria bacterium]
MRRLARIRRLRRRRTLCAALRLARRALVALAAACVLWVLAYRWIDPPTTPYMLAEAWRLGGVEHEWVPISAMSEWVPLAAAAAEDSGFCGHWGFDFAAIRAAWSETHRLRGGSTISQQVAKNAFLWQGRSWLRKGLEAGFTLLVELLWPKRRIMEVYLNIIEMDEGAFGIAAAARRYFGKEPARLTPREAALIASLLPDPRRWDAARPTGYLSRRARAVEQGATTLKADGRAACFL